MWSIASPHVSAVVSPIAAMLFDVVFRLPGGARFEPFAKAPWFGQPGSGADLPEHLRWLGAEFVCLPFGVGGPVEHVSPEWLHCAVHAQNLPPHGPAANERWSLVRREPDFIVLEFVYPPDHPVRAVRRSLKACADAPALDLELVIESRAAARTSLGLHPILSLERPDATLSIDAQFRFGLTYPAAVPGNRMAAAVGKQFDSLRAVPSSSGASIDLSRLPLGEPVEDVLLLCGVEAPIEIADIQNRARLRLDWDRTLLPNCQLWISDRALQSDPWGGRYRGLGVEPVAAAFDFADSVSTNPNPISERGAATSLMLDPDRPLSLRYRLEALDWLKEA